MADIPSDDNQKNKEGSEPADSVIRQATDLPDNDKVFMCHF